MVLEAGDSSSAKSEVALARLCQIYWYPIYVYLRRHGKSSHDAEDLTQGFLARLCHKQRLGNLIRDKGKFRSFLLVALKHFVADDAARALEEDVTSFALANEAGLAATGHDDGVIRVFHLGDDVSQTTLLTGHSGRIHNLEFSGDSKWLISDAQDRSVRLWEAKTGHEVRHWNDVDSDRFAFGSWEATSFSFSSDDALFTVPNGETRSIEIWSLLKRKRLASHRFAKNGLFSQAAILPGNQVLAVAGTGGYLTLQNVSDGTRLANQKSQLLGLHALAVSPTGDRIAVGAN